MSENWEGLTFANQKVSPAADGLLHNAVFGDSTLAGCELSVNGQTVSMSPGYLVIGGRLIHNPTEKNWSIGELETGYARICLNIDLSRESTKYSFDQVFTSIQYAEKLWTLPELTSENINESGMLYQAALCTVSLLNGGIYAIEKRIRVFGGLNPGQFGLYGFENIPAGADLNTYLTCGNYRGIGDFDLVNCPVDGVFTLQVRNAIGTDLQAISPTPTRGYLQSNRFEQVIHAIDGTAPNQHFILRRIVEKDDGTGMDDAIFHPWRWENPPMKKGIEYVTMANWLDKPIKCRLIDCGNAKASMTVPLNVTASTILHSVATCGIPASDISGSGFSAKVESNQIIITASGANVGKPVYVAIWYV